MSNNKNNNTSHKSSSASYPVITPPPGHQRNRIACTNCRRCKVKCLSTGKRPPSPCERCVKEGATCEYAAASPDEEGGRQGFIGGHSPTPQWVEPLNPESYARNHGMSSAPTAPQAPSMYPGYGGQSAGQANNSLPPSHSRGYSHSSQISQPGFGGQLPGGIPGSQFQPPVPSAYAPYMGPGGRLIHYGPFPGPANTVYPWSQPPAQK
ncbi:hypothetical protein C8R43DRAFT_1121955 [Mycena crocata]|nr:hypothetical protein C8R43DRAFT_1121955 [Mycena crocata]